MKVVSEPAELITLIDVKHQCRIEHEDEDALLTRYISSAYKAVERFTDKTLFVGEIPEGEDKDASLLLTEDINIACLMLIAHWYTNREAAAGNMVNVADMPFGVKFLLQPYRRMGV